MKTKSRYNTSAFGYACVRFLGSRKLKSSRGSFPSCPIQLTGIPHCIKTAKHENTTWVGPGSTVPWIIPRQPKFPTRTDKIHTDEKKSRCLYLQTSAGNSLTQHVINKSNTNISLFFGEKKMKP